MKKVAIPMEELMAVLQLQMETAGSAVLNVTGWSMLPMLHNRRDSVTICPVEARCNRGDVILYRRKSGQYVLHRVLRRTEEGYILCGDNQFFTEKVEHDQLLAVVTGFTRKGKTYSVSHPGYRFYTGIWVFFHPVRWLYLMPRRAVGRIRTQIRHRQIRKLIKRRF